MKVILLGPPGAGKGTQAEVLCKHFKIPHISTGNILREAIDSGSRFGAEAKKLMDKGILVSDELIVGIVALILVSSVILPLCIGTLKSTLTRTFFPSNFLSVIYSPLQGDM